MPKRTITLTFGNPINISLHATKPSGDATSDPRAHDLVYRQYTIGGDKVVALLGECIAVNRTTNTISVEIDRTTPTPVVANGDFIFFGKSQTIGTSGMTGYYAEIEMKNLDTNYAELFAVSSELFESSK